MVIAAMTSWRPDPGVLPDSARSISTILLRLLAICCPIDFPPWLQGVEELIRRPCVLADGALRGRHGRVHLVAAAVVGARARPRRPQRLGLDALAALQPR